VKKYFSDREGAYKPTRGVPISIDPLHPPPSPLAP